MSTQSKVPVIYRGTAFSVSLIYRNKETKAGYDLRGKRLIFHLRGSNRNSDALVLNIDDPANSNASRLFYTDAEHGVYKLNIGKADILLFDFDACTWWIGLDEAGNEKPIARGKFFVVNP